MDAESPADLRTEAMRLISNGVYVLTACLGHDLHAATVTWVSQVSFHPPLMMVALRRSSHLSHAVRKAHRFALNILEPGQVAVAQTFFDHTTVPETAPDLAGYPFRAGAAHCPLLLDALGWLECRLAAEPASPGDHSLFLGEVTAAGVRRAGSPMVLANTPWAYGGLAES